MNFSEKLKKHRKELGMSQEELSFQLNVSRQAVSKWENDQGFPETDKLLLLSNLFGVSLDYLLKEDPSISLEDKEQGYYASRETVEGYLASKASGAKKTALAVGIIIFSMSFPILLDEGVGTTLFMLSIALAVGMLVLNGFSVNRYADLESQPLVFDPAFFREFKDSYEARRKHHGIKIVFGIVLILLSVTAIVILEEIFLIDNDLVDTIIPIAVSFSVYLFILSGSALKAEKILMNNEEHMKEVSLEKKDGWIYGSVMPLTAMIFLAIGFKTGAWHPAWLVFPVAALVCKFIITIKNLK